MSLVYAGIAPLIRQPVFRIVLEGAAALVLGLLAWGSWKEALERNGSTTPDGTAGVSFQRGALASGFVITLSNPMTVVFYLSLFGGAVATLHEAPGSTHLLFVASVMVGCLLWCFGLALALGWGKGRIGPKLRRGILVGSALALAGFAARFLVEGVLEVADQLG